MSASYHAVSPTQAGVYACAVILLVVATVVVFLRLLVRQRKNVGYGLDDFLIIASTLVFWGSFVVLILGTSRGSFGTHTRINPKTGKVIPTWNESDASKLQFVSQLMFIVCYGTIKLSVLALFRRIFVGQTFQYVSIASMVIVSMWTTAFFFATLFQCGRNPTWLWQSPVTYAKHCGDEDMILLGHTVSDLVLDLFILTIPLPIIYKLKMRLAQKLGLLFVFVLGYLSTAAAAARVAYVVEYIYVTTIGARDVRGDLTNYITWGYVEAGVGIIAASLTTIRPLLRARLPESIINSVRSKVSLGSRSGKSPSAPQSATGISGSGGSNVELPREGELFGQPRSNQVTSIESVSPIEPTDPAGIQVMREFRLGSQSC